MRATTYNRKIIIQKRTKVPNDIGGWANVWADYYTSWASVIATGGLKRLEYGRLGFVESYEIEMRRRNENVDSDCQVIYNEKTFQINSIQISDVVKLDIAR